MQGPDGRHLFGVVKVGEKGQIVIPKEARDLFGIKPGSSLMVAADKNGIALFHEDGEIFKAFCAVLGGAYGENRND